MYISKENITTLLSKGLLLLFLIFILFHNSSHAASQTVALPVNLDYPLLEKLIINRAFPEQGEKNTLVNEMNGCFFLSLAEPRFSEHDGQLKMETKIYAKAGTPLGQRCFGAVEWRGYLVLYQEPYIQPNSWKLSFNTVSTELLGRNRQPQKVSGMVWKFAEPRVIEYLNSLYIDLIPPIDNLKNFLYPLFPPDVKEKTGRMVASMRPGQVQVSPESIHVDILADVEETYVYDENTYQKNMEGEELKRTIQLWEAWDSMLTFLITLIPHEKLTTEEKRILTDVLLDTRYRFVEGLSDHSITHDFVREQFIEAWSRLSPIFKAHLYKTGSAAELLGYLGFISSSDALLVFDALGPTFGIEISRNGLVRLMRMLNGDPSLLNYPGTINPKLQDLFDMDGKTSGQPSAHLQPTRSFLQLVLDYLAPTSAHGATPSFKEILKWKVPQTDIDSYIGKIDTLLNGSIRTIIKEGKVPADQKEMFKQLIIALAWQESCYRQFVVKNNELTYLLSYNNSSVGLMQINERVWRGIYNRQQLRWDIRYNSIAGCEISAKYLTRYALKDKTRVSSLNHKEMAGLVYAMYNGGPGQYGKYLERIKTRDFYLSDRLFNEKYGHVAAGDTKNLSRCLTGG